MKAQLSVYLLSIVVACADLPTNYSVVWTSPSKDSLDSMPLSGRQGVGANVWVEDGSIWVYLGHSGAFDEQGRLLKLGCLRITPASGVLTEPESFRQELDLASGSIRMKADGLKVSLWFAAQNLIIETVSDKPEELKVAFGTWRDCKRDGLKLQLGRIQTLQPDHVTAGKGGFAWAHRNADYPNDLPGLMKSNGMTDGDVNDMITHRVFGGAVAAEGGLSQPVESKVNWQFWEGTAWTGTTAAKKQHVIVAALRAEQNGDSTLWLKQAQASLSPEIISAARTEELKRWQEFWTRSHIVVNSGAAATDPGWLVGQNYQLFRYMTACNRDGEQSLLFNGGIFTIDNKPGRITGNNNNQLEISPGAPTTPDYRRWMFCGFALANQVCVGWPTLAAGDADMLAPFVSFCRDRVSTAAARARNLGAEGVAYHGMLDVWGFCSVSPLPNGMSGAGHLKRHYSMSLEQAWMALQGHDTLGVSLEKDLSWIEKVVYFYDSYYRAQCLKLTGKETGTDGRLIIYPATGLEHAADATDPVDVVAGLRRVTESLLSLSELSAESRKRLSEIQARLPEVATGMRDGKKAVLPARAIGKEWNPWEPIEMYAAWPYRLMGVTSPGTLQMARDTWDTIPAARANFCKQDYSGISIVADMAVLNLPAEAKQRVIYKLSNIAAPQGRFPAFFGPGHDWFPDHNWGGTGMTGLQTMLMCSEPGVKGKIHLFPGWPKEWDVDFKLHAPGQTVVECVYHAGKIKKLKVTPAARAKDVVNWLDENQSMTRKSD